ncbi:hypothetical protein [Clostridium butyricum]|uniref:hypothetical protein n=1 Tax=Clostridium butyricum TaxID=1492 RepID=UPI00374F941C
MYGDAQISISKNFSNKRRIDLYIEFKSGEKEKESLELVRLQNEKLEIEKRRMFLKNE